MDGVFQRMDDKNMTPAVEIDKGALASYCRECKLLEEIPKDFDIEEHYGEIVCSSCGKKTAVAPMLSLKDRFNIK